MIEGLHSVKNFADSRDIILFLGDMRELGPLEKSAHEELAHEIVKIFRDVKNIKIFLVGRVM